VNVAVLAVDRQVAQTVKIDGKELPLRPGAKGLLPQVYYRKTPEGWIEIDHETSFALAQNLDGFKSPTVHGPIDDAFRESFVVVVPSKEPWQPRPADWANRRLADFQATWGKQFRGDVRVKRDTDVSESDIAEHHLILFGDPGSNVMLAKVLKGLPIEWSRESFKLGRDYPSRNHLPILIAPNPINPKRYVVVNSGPTFKSSDFDGTNALLFPRLGDWAVIDTEAVNEAEAVVTSGEFNQRWQLP